jgi:hypothetical protein
MASLILATVIFHHMSGLNEDNIVNDFTFYSPTNLTSGIADTINTRLNNFYTAGGSSSIMYQLSACIDRGTNRAEVRIYDVTDHEDGTAHGSPDFTRFFTPAGGGSFGANPAELAVCLSFRGAYDDAPEFGSELGPGGGRVRLRARRRGRIYLGPWNNQSVAEDAVTHRTYVKPTIRTSITAAAKTLMDLTDPQWVVWSRKGAQGAGLAGAFYPIVQAWVDDAWDIQRRRGEDPQARTTVVHA